MEKYVVKKFVVRIMCILICIGITMSMPACSSESKNEKYTIYYTNSSKDKLIGSTCMLDASMSVEDKVRTLLDNMGVRSSSKDEYIIKPDNVNLLESSVKGKTAFLNFTTTYKQMPSQVELLYRAAVVKTLTQLDDISYVHFMWMARKLYMKMEVLWGCLRALTLQALIMISGRWIGVMYSCFMQMRVEQDLLK